MLTASPLLVWGLFSRLLGLVFLISFVSLSFQVVAIAGERGTMPVRLFLSKVRADFPTVRRFLYFPTLLWLSPSDRMLRAHVYVGIAAALYALYGGPHSPCAIGLCYLVYLSLDRAIGFVFPWDCLLFEAGFFGMFLPATAALPDLAALEAPAPAIAWAYRLLVFRLMLGFGKFKFIGSTKQDKGYLTGFLINQPLVSPLGFYLHKAPLFLLELAVVAMFVQEIVMPFLFLLPNELGVVAAAAIAALMVGIWACGNFGYFNLLVICLCVVALDATTPRQLQLSTLFSVEGPWFTNLVVLVHTIGALIVFPFNSFCGQSWHLWPVFLRVRPRFLAFPIAFFRALSPLRWLHPYGVFPPKTMPGVRCIPLFEATWDGENWVECPHEISPTQERSRPRFIAPHHPRGDQVAVYEGFGLNDASMLHGLVGSGNPYGFTKVTGARLLVQRVLEGHAPSYGNVFFAKGVFPEHLPPPVAMRATTHMLTPRSHEERSATGKWWKRQYIGPHMPEVRVDPEFWNELLPEPEQWHPEEILWRRRSKLAELLRQLRAGRDVDEAVLAHAPELGADVETFWSDFLPEVIARDRSSFASLPDLVEDLRARHDRRTLRSFERLAGRYTFMLFEALEPLFSGAGVLPIFGFGKPVIDVKSHLHLWMLCQVILCEGREVYRSVLADPRKAADHAPKLQLAAGLYLLGLFRYEIFVFEAQKLRLLTAVMEPKRVQFSLPDPRLTALLDAIAMRTFGVVEVVPFLREQFRGPRFEGDQPERYPAFELRDDGVVAQVEPSLVEHEGAKAQAS